MLLGALINLLSCCLKKSGKKEWPGQYCAYAKRLHISLRLLTVDWKKRVSSVSSLSSHKLLTESLFLVTVSLALYSSKSVLQRIQLPATSCFVPAMPQGTGESSRCVTDLESSRYHRVMRSPAFPFHPSSLGYQ